MYVCGPTVQSSPHIGHGRFAVVFDLVRRYLRWRGYQVTYVRNITDVEDKIIAAAAEAGEPWEERARRMTAEFHRAFEALGVEPPDVEPKATEHIDDMIRLIERLIDRGLAYPASNGDVYFSVRKLDDYGKLSGRDPDELLAGPGSRYRRRRPTRSTSPCGRPPNPANPPGSRRGVRADPDGTSSALPCRCGTWGRRSTSTEAGST
ncbi:MAG: hypothetical protein KatS3mg011_0992 [Acidimicrobiia bacterium]|nr:MAG: hypothetical protein KatS3mg011_0992 [Acidimicrobiia bacterium]